MPAASILHRISKLDDEVNILLNVSKGAKTRRKRLKTLQYSVKNCNQIANEIGVDWWTVQKHLKRLEKAGLVKNVNLGRIQFYKMTLKGESFFGIFKL